MILRRCTLDTVGLASWENPTYIKCVSKNYQNIQMLVIKMLNTSSVAPSWYTTDIQINLLTPLPQSRDYISKVQQGQSVDGVAEVISRLRFASDDGTKYSGDLLAIMETLKNTTDLYNVTKQKLSNADVVVRKHFYIKILIFKYKIM